MAWVDAMGVNYPFAFAKDNALYDAIGVRGIPHAAIVDPEGNVLWSGSPYSLSNKTIKTALKGASKTLTFGWGKDFADAAKAVVAGDFGKALKVTDKLASNGNENAAAVRASILSKLDGRVAAMEKAHKKGDFLAAMQIAEALDGNLGELEQAATVTKTLEDIEGDSDAKRILAGQKSLAKIMGGNLDKTRMAESAMKKATALAKKYDGTIVEEQAKDFVKKVKARIQAKR